MLLAQGERARGEIPGPGDFPPVARVAQRGCRLGDWLFGIDDFDGAEPVEWSVDEEHLDGDVGLDVGLG